MVASNAATVCKAVHNTLHGVDLAAMKPTSNFACQRYTARSHPHLQHILAKVTIGCTADVCVGLQQHVAGLQVTMPATSQHKVSRYAPNKGPRPSCAAYL